ncbi:MAG: xanthine dehydrogenase family protein molybdopterin-binding subunit [Pseudomonadota bacterium]|nr:xanthine dehydrogenase family protein molybdopterin-binding subunit [Pseudomonadota bacterium]
MTTRPPKIGRDFLRPDAPAKAAGVEKYAVDHYGENLLWAGVRRAGVPHGLIRRVDAAAARSLPGVRAVLTGGDVPGTNRQGIVHKDQPVLCDAKVRYAGDPVALVLAADRETLRRALALIEVDIAPLPGVFTIDDALNHDAPRLHEDHPGGNALLQATIEAGDGAKALAECDVVVTETFTVPIQAHAFLETENGIARREEDGRIVIIVSTQAPFRDRWEVSHALGLPMDGIRVIAPYLGGGFGGKDGATVQCLLALAAMHADGRWVKMWWDREESFQAGYKRHAARLHYHLGAKADGTLHALHCRVYYDTGAYAHLGGEVMALGMEHAGGPYRIPHTRIEGWCLYTNNPVAGAMRGFGVMQVSFAFESMMDILAARLRLDPLEIRRKNALRVGDRNSAGVLMTSSTGIGACLDAIADHPLWKDRAVWKAAAGPNKRRGVGLAAVFNAMGYGRGLPDTAVAKLEITPTGRFVVYSGVADMGQGNATAFVQIAGAALNQEEGMIDLVQPDTDRTLPSGSAAASRTTYTYGNALIRACQDMRRRILGRASMLLLVDRLEDLGLLPGRVRHPATGREIPLAMLAATLTTPERFCVYQYLMPVVPDPPATGKAFKIGFPHLLFSYGCHLALVEADELTGETTVRDYLAVTEAGRILNPQTSVQQVQGAIAQGIGYALHEDLQVEGGIVQTDDLGKYIIPTALDLPDIRAVFAQAYEETGPFGMKGLGEVASNGPLPAIANALADAGAARIFRSPLTPERVLASLQQGPGM